MNIGEPKKIEPESPERLRECLMALATHSGCSVLRMEIGLGPSTHQEGTSITMVVTHSLGPEHEAKIAPKLAKAFFATLQALGSKVSYESQSEGNTDG